MCGDRRLGERQRGKEGLEGRVEDRARGDGIGGRVGDPLHHGHQTSYM